MHANGRLGAAVVEPLRMAVRLTPRELQVLTLVADGLTYEEIATTLGIGVETARTHLAKARDRLGAQSRTEAVAQGFRLGLID